MDYKERYMHALKKIREGLQPLQDGTKISGVTRAFLEEVFPELKESENEKIRKWLLDTITQIPNDSIEWDVIEKAKVLSWLEKQGKQKPTWSVEDSSKVQRICQHLDEAKKYYADITEIRECVDWLKSLKERVQPKQKWSEEDEKIVLGIEQVYNCVSLLNIAPDKIDDVKKWHKSLKERLS